MKKIGFFVTLPRVTIGDIDAAANAQRVPKWRVVQIAVGCLPGKMFVPIGGPRRKARGERG